MVLLKSRLIGGYLQPGSECKYHVFEDEYQDTTHITGECQQGNVLEIPEEIHLFEPHGNHAGSRTYYEQASAHTGTVCQQAPSWTNMAAKAGSAAAATVAGSPIGYIPMAAATSGTLSITDERIPIIELIA